jgi:hypothetical protein
VTRLPTTTPRTRQQRFNHHQGPTVPIRGRP